MTDVNNSNNRNKTFQKKKNKVQILIKDVYYINIYMDY